MRNETLTSYEEWSRQRRLQQGNAAQIVMESVHDKPDEVAGVLNMAKAFGALSGYVPHFSMAKQFQSDFEREIIRRHNQQILKDTPKLSLWLRNPEFAGIAKDDLANLGWFEGAARGAWNTAVAAGDRIGQGFSQWRFETALGDLRYIDGFEVGHRAFLNDTPESIAAFRQKLQERANYWAEKVDYFSKSRERNPKSLSAARYEAAANSGGKDAGFWQAAGNYATSFVIDPLGGLAWALETAGESAPHLAAAVGATLATRNPRVGMTVMGAGSYATERYTSPEEFFHEKGLDLSKPEDVAKIINDPQLMKDAAERGVIRGLVIGAFDALSVGLAGKVMADNPMREALAQSATQMVLGGGGEAMARLAAGQKMDWNEVMAEAFAELATTPVDMVVAGRKLGAFHQAAEAARIVKDNLQAISQKTQGSLLRKRMPDKFGEFVDDALKGSGHETLYVDAGALNEYFQSQGLEAASVISSLDGVGIVDFERALNTGGDIAIPTASYGAHIAGSDFDAWLQDNARFDPADMSAAQAADFDERAQVLFEELVEEEAKNRQIEEASQTVEQQILEEMTARLTQAGRAANVAANEALVYPAFYRTMAERNGLSLQEMLERYPLPEIRGDLPQLLQEKDVDELTRLLAVARKGVGKMPADRRVSLLEFIDDLGGINDVGGELRARNAEIVKRGRGKKALRLWRERTDGGRGVDEIASAVVEAGYLADDPEVMAYKNALREGREAPDIVRALWAAIDEELRGRPSYAGEADAAVQGHMDLEAQIADLEQYLDRLGLGLEDSDADIRAAIERDKAQREYGQSDYDRGGRKAKATINGDVVLEPLVLNDLPAIDGYKNAQAAVVKGTFENRSGDKVLVSNRSVTKWFHGRENAIKRSLAPHFHKIFEQSVSYHKGENGFSYAAGLIELDGKQVGVRFAVKQEKGNPDKLYYIEGIETVSEEGLPPIYRESLKDKSIIGLERGGEIRVS